MKKMIQKIMLKPPYLFDIRMVTQGKYDKTDFCGRWQNKNPQPCGCGLVEEGGFEPPKAKPADLQSVPFGHLGTLPYQIVKRWSWWTDSNPRPADYKSAALPAELHQQTACFLTQLCHFNRTTEICQAFRENFLEMRENARDHHAAAPGKGRNTGGTLHPMRGRDLPRRGALPH